MNGAANELNDLLAKKAQTWVGRLGGWLAELCVAALISDAN